ITIAVDPEELNMLSEALALQFDIVCVAHSGQADNVPPQWLRVPVSVRAVSAFATVTPEDILDPFLGSVRWDYFDAKKASAAGMVTDLGKVLGRAVRFNVPEGRPFLEQDFVTKDMVAVPLCVRPVAAYAQVVPQDLVDPQSGIARYVYVKRKELAPD